MTAAEKELERGERARALRWLASLAAPYRGKIALACLALMLSGGVSLLLPAVAGRVVDAALVEKSLERLRGIVLGLIALFAVSATFSYAETWLLRSTAARILRGLRARLFDHLTTLSPAFFERERVGELISRLNNDVGSIGELLTHSLASALQQALMLAGAIVLLGVLHPQLLGVMLLCVPPVVVVAVLFGLRFEKLSKRQQQNLADATVTAEESLAGIRTVQAFVAEPEVRARYGERVGRVLDLGLRLARTWGAFGALVSFFSFTAVTLVLWYGGRLVVEGELSPGELTSFLLYTGTVAAAVGTLTSVWGGLKSATGATARVRELLSTQPVVSDPPAPRQLASVRGEVVFDAVRFAYPSRPDAPAIEGVALAVRPGEMVALVGPSGAGKSTLLALLLRFHDPQQGAVRLDGVDVRELRLAELRRALGLVPQEVFLLGGTIEENLRLARPGASDAELEAAARAAAAHDFIAALPEGYRTVVGERGVRLSGGERQRIAIARVLLADPRVVLLDEATSALDAESEHAVQQGLARLFEGRTTLVIAHRLATVKRADRVVLLERGRVVAAGTHEELLATAPLYRRLCELQMLDLGES
jgi:ABC transporter fused permease/ATP-binding protein